MFQEAQITQSPISEWAFFTRWEEDEILATYIIPHVEAVARAPQRIWHEGRCYFGLAAPSEPPEDAGGMG